MSKFSEFLNNQTLNESKQYLGAKIGDILTAGQDLQQDIDSLGARQVSRMADELVNQIRKILHSQWQTHQKVYLKELQAVAVMIKKAIEDKKDKGSTFDLKETIKIAIQKLEEISTKLGEPVNKMQAPPEDAGDELEPDDFELTGEQPDPNQQQQQEQQPQQ